MIENVADSPIRRGVMQLRRLTTLLSKFLCTGLRGYHMSLKHRIFLFLIISVLASLGCTTGSRSGQAATVESLTLDQAEITDQQLTHSLGRFADNYLASLSQQVDDYLGGGTTLAERREVLRWYVSVMSVAWSIANGPDPELNLLDMLTQMTLTRMEVEGSLFPLMG